MQNLSEKRAPRFGESAVTPKTQPFHEKREDAKQLSSLRPEDLKN
jgi:hypothetical protein